jgi:hypothetical protein
MMLRTVVSSSGLHLSFAHSTRLKGRIANLSQVAGRREPVVARRNLAFQNPASLGSRADMDVRGP